MWSCRMHLAEVVEQVDKKRMFGKKGLVLVSFMPEKARERNCTCQFCNAPAQFNAVESKGVGY